MSRNLNGKSTYQQMNQTRNKADTKNKKARNTKIYAVSKPKGTSADTSKVTSREWKPINTRRHGALVPKFKEGYDYAIGDVKLSDEAKKYYDALKTKCQNAEFILVSEKLKTQVGQNAAAYGNAGKMVVLINEKKLERMASEEDFRKKYEGIVAIAGRRLERIAIDAAEVVHSIITLANKQILNAKNSLADSDVNVKNFGLVVKSDNTLGFFATLEKDSEAAKRAKRKGEYFSAVKESESTQTDGREYIQLEADHIDALIVEVQDLAYEQAS